MSTPLMTRFDAKVWRRSWKVKFSTPEVSDGFYHYASGASAAHRVHNGLLILHGDGSLDPCVPMGGESVAAAPHLTVEAPTITPPFLVVDAYPVSPAPPPPTF